MWHIRSTDGTRWLRYDAGTVDADPATAAALAGLTAGSRIEAAPQTGHVYTARSSTDPVAVYLIARGVCGYRATITGTPPALPPAPQAPAGAAAGRVY